MFRRRKKGSRLDSCGTKVKRGDTLWSFSLLHRLSRKYSTSMLKWCNPSRRLYKGRGEDLWSSRRPVTTVLTRLNKSPICVDEEEETKSYNKTIFNGLEESSFLFLSVFLLLFWYKLKNILYKKSRLYS